MSDIVEDLRYAEHVIDERVMKVMDAGADTIESLRQQLAASQAREQQLREALSMHIHLVESNAHQLSGKAHGFAKQAIAIPNDTTAL